MRNGRSGPRSLGGWSATTDRGCMSRISSLTCGTVPASSIENFGGSVPWNADFRDVDVAGAERIWNISFHRSTAGA